MSAKGISAASLESRVASLEGQFEGPWTSAEGSHSDTAADRIVQLELQVKGLIRWVNYVNTNVHNVPREGVSDETAPSPHEFIESTRATLDNRRRKSRRLFNKSTREHLAPSPGSSQPFPRPSPPSTQDAQGKDQYSYVPLNAASSEIRILALRSSNDPREPLQGRLLITSLDQRENVAPQSISNNFATLSYTWGHLAKTDHILIDKKKLNITNSLYKALIKLRELVCNLPNDVRPSNFETYWWIDAICINQEDIDERSSQVRLMTRLYKHSRITHVWLGEESSDSAQAIALIRKLAYEPKPSGEERKNWEYIRKPGQTHRSGGPGRPAIELPTELELSDRERTANRLAITSFFQRPWWSRVWVRQEVALTDYVTVHCGRDNVDWYKVMKAAQILSLVAALDPGSGLREAKATVNTDVTCYEVASSLQAIRSQTGTSHSDYVSLDSLLAYSRDCQSQDAKDKVYAMLGLTDPDEITIVPSYRKSTDDLYIETALEMLKSGIDFFRICHNPTLSKKINLPSWVPNLSMPLPHVPIEIRETLFSTSSLHDVFPGRLEFAYSQHEACLHIKGAVFDNVVAIGAPSLNDYNDWYGFYKATGGSPGLQPDRYCSVYEDQKQWEQSIVRPLLQSNSTFDAGPFGSSGRFGSNSRSGSTFQFGTSSAFETSGDQRPLFGASSNENSISPWRPLVNRGLNEDPHVRLAKQLLSSRPMAKARENSSSNHEANSLFNVPNSTITGNTTESLIRGRRPIRSEQGALALAPTGTKLGDKFCVFQGSRYGYVIRKINENTYALVGQLYFLGITNSQTIQNITKLKVIRLV